ncbi:metal ABC transporter ATP-binding protein [Pontibacillus salicampi]|uniref:Metal ABC transporter ATP-binding protein n=1 Tax=Pontibacillus salicampi TaxID=1449801 RepID=A0ABV6LKS6_9BACI
MKQTIIEVNNLSVNYGNVTALSDVNLSIYEKEFLTIIGPNGGGKSTLLKAMLGLIAPSSGTIDINKTSESNRKARLGYVPQFSNLDKRFPITVYDLVIMGRFYKKIGPFHRYTKKDKQAAWDTINRLGLKDLTDRQIGELSGGQFQRVLVARALVSNPHVLMLDEPTASVDKSSSEDIYHLLTELKKEMTIIVVSHDTTVVSSYTESVACLNQSLHYHGDSELPEEVIYETYGTNVDIISHANKVKHRVLTNHEEVE